MLIKKDEFDSVAREKIDLVGECECCGGDMDMFEVTQYPLCDKPEHSKYFTGYCPKCDAYYKQKKSVYIKRNRE